ncbi:ferredoxin [Streptomyces sp. NPDC127079]|uniref:ferredoxin n=1 Tax=Streptomyces sp. NPDC127079 TaxID=3347132 RepID=UPI003653EA69
MKVLVDRGKCQGYGNCVVAEPTVFDLDDDGFVQLLVDEPSEELRAQVQHAVRDCPARALGLED